MTGNNLRILVVDDDRAIRRLLNVTLSANHYQVYEAENAKMALEAVPLHRPDLVILDLGLPDMDGVEVVHSLRTWSQIPILILSVRGQESQKVAALDAGADDYLTKPFGIGELLARIRVAMRRLAGNNPEALFATGELEVDLARRLVRVAGVEVQLTPTEYDLLRLLILHAGKVLTHHQLLHEVWGPSYSEELHLLRVNISNLRRKVEPEPTRPRYVITEPGVGYRLRH
jgi:two-component system KDP operon response regulator KdpE